MPIKRYSETRSFAGKVGFYSHHSDTCSGEMKFGVFQPPQAEKTQVPVLYFLSGLTCTPETFMIKANALRIAANLGLMLVVPDTSPRNTNIKGEDDTWDIGSGAGFYLNATQEPWVKHYQMATYLTDDLPTIIEKNFATKGRGESSIFGHSMGGHGALVLGLKNPSLFKSISVFAPICAPARCPWGEKAFNTYLDGYKQTWDEWDASKLVENNQHPAEILLDYGLNDEFLQEQLNISLFEGACSKNGQKLKSRKHMGYDHGYYFISTFIEDHLQHHARYLL